MNIKFIRIYNDEIYFNENHDMMVRIPLSNDEIIVVPIYEQSSIIQMIHHIWNMCACMDPSNSIYIFYNEDDASMANMIGMCSIIPDYELVAPMKNTNI